MAARAGADTGSRTRLAVRSAQLAQSNAPEEVSPAGHFARVRNTQADAGEFLPPGAAQPADVPHVDGIFQPDHGGKLGIELLVLGGAGGRDGHAAGQLNVLVPEWTQQTVENDFRHASGGLAGAAAILRSVGDDVTASKREQRQRGVQ